MKHTIIVLLLLLSVINSWSMAERTVLIMDFENKGFRLAGLDFSSWIPTQIQESLVGRDWVSIVERDKLESVLKEQALATSGVMDPAAAIKVGKLLGAQKIVLGDYQGNNKERYHISTRLVDVEHGNVEGQWIIADIPKKKIEGYCQDVADNIAGLLKQQTALLNLAGLENPDNPFNLRFTNEKTSYQYGDMMSISLTADKDCFVYLFDVGTSGKIHLLFPNKMQRSNRLMAGKEIQISNLRVSPPAGKEMVKAIATVDSLDIQKMMDIASTPATFELIDSDTHSFSRDLELVVSPLPREKWNTATLELLIGDTNEQED